MLKLLGRVRSCSGVLAGALIACLAVCGPAWAQPINIELVLVGNAGNASDPLRPGVGGVNYQYYISKREVTVGQWCAMLNSVSTSGETVLYTTNMTSMISRTGSPGSYVFTPIGDPQLPMRFVNYTMMQRFCNWLHNGQPVGNVDATTASGSYGTLGGPRITAWTWVIPTWSEWHKAAYGNVGNTYTRYPTASNTAPTASAPPGGANSANISSVVGTVTPAGAYAASLSYWGTLDQGGNVMESTEKDPVTGQRVSVGGSFTNGASNTSSNGGTSSWGGDISGVNNSNGFRVVRAVVVSQAGACCLPNFAGCIVTEGAGACQALGGTFNGVGTPCASLPCNTPRGACCIPAAGGCQVLTQAECEGPSYRGRYCGNGTVCAGCCLPPASVVFVRADAPPGGDGWSWATAFNDLSDALSRAEYYSGYIDEIWVAGGTYRPGRGVILTTSLFRVRVPVFIRGGFAGTESNPSQRTFTGPPTVLSADLLGDDQPNQIARFDNTNQILDIAAPSSEVEYLTFSGAGGASSSGPTTALLANSGVVIRKCKFTSNRGSNDGTAVDTATLVMEQCEVIGTGPSAVRATRSTLVDCTFTNPQGTMVKSGVISSVLGCTFTGSSDLSIGIRGTSAAGSTIDQCQFRGGGTGLIIAPADTAVSTLLQSLTLSNCSFADMAQAATLTTYANVSGSSFTRVGSFGGQGALVFVAGRIASSTFVDNAPAGALAIAYNPYGSVTPPGCIVIDTCTFTGNSAPRGGAINLSTSCVTLTGQTTFADNTAPRGAAVMMSSGSLKGQASFGPAQLIENEWGTISPGDASLPGSDPFATMDVSGGYRASPASGSSIAVMEFAVGRDAAGLACSSLVANGGIDLGQPRIRLSPQNGFVFAAGDSFELIRAGSLLCDASSIDVPQLAPGLVLDLEITSTTVTAVVRTIEQMLQLSHVRSCQIAATPIDSVCADVDGDGFPDLACLYSGAAAQSDPGVLRIYRNRGLLPGGGWAGFDQQPVQVATPINPVMLDGGHVNGDDAEDLVVACYAGASLMFAAGVQGGGGTVATTLWPLSLPTGGSSGAISSALITIGTSMSHTRAVPGTTVNAPPGTSAGLALGLSRWNGWDESRYLQVSYNAGVLPTRWSFAWKRTPGGPRYASISLIAPNPGNPEVIIDANAAIPDEWGVYAIDNAQLVPGAGDGFIYRIRFFGETDGVGAVHFDNMLLTELGTGRQSFRDFAATSPLFAAGICIDRSAPSKAANIAVSWNDGQSSLRFAGVDVWYNNGGGSMTQSSAVLASNTNSATPAVLLEDLNADGISDLVYQIARVGSISGSNLYAVGAADYPGGPTRFEGASGIPTATGATRFRSGRLAGASQRGIIFDDPWRVQALGLQGNAFSARINPLLTIGSSRRFCAFDAEGDGSDGVVTVAGSADGRMQYFRALVDDGSAPRFAPAANVGTADIASEVHTADVDSDGVPDLVVLEKDRVIPDRWYAGAYLNLRDPVIICIGDFNHDGGVDGTDAFAFMTAWEEGAATADLNSDGGIDGQDVNTFFEAWESGC